MAKLTAKRRGKLPNTAFAVKGRKYPIGDKPRARNALARVSQHGTAAEKATVRRKVHSRFPDIGAKGSAKHGQRKRVSKQ